VGEDRGLNGEVGVLVVAVVAWPLERAFQARKVAELVTGLGDVPSMIVA
jgi:hypothetical protein